MIYISNQDVLAGYLKERGLLKNTSSCTIHYCQGGVSCTVAYVEIDGRPMIIKQALEQLKTKDTWLCDPNRMYIEYESNKIYHDLLPENAPETYFYDNENYIYGREAVPDGCQMWKEDLMKGLIDYKVAEKVVDTLAAVHNHCAGREDIARMFENKDVFHALRISPYIDFTVTKHPEITEFAQRVSDEMMDSKITLIHGDYSPKNIMVTEDGMKVLDYEVANYGHPAFDLAFLSNHFILKAVKFQDRPGEYLDLLDYTVKRYFKSLTCMDLREFEPVYIRTLALLMLARIDGKSPVEYLLEEKEKQELVRRLSLTMIKDQMDTYSETIKMLRNEIRRMPQ